MTYTYYPRGICSNKMVFDIENGSITALQIEQACPGNAAAISKLVIGMTPEEVIARLEGIPCGKKASSCPDQLAQALKQASVEASPLCVRLARQQTIILPVL